MDTRTGKISELVNIENFEEQLKNKLTQLTKMEYEIVSKLDESERPVELALMRFVEQRKKLNAPCGLEVKNAFRLGYKQCLKDRGERNE